MGGFLDVRVRYRVVDLFLDVLPCNIKLYNIPLGWYNLMKGKGRKGREGKGKEREWNGGKCITSRYTFHCIVRLVSQASNSQAYP